MTARTPEQMRALADRFSLMSRFESTSGERLADLLAGTAALRAAADQLEAVQAMRIPEDKCDFWKVDALTARDELRKALGREPYDHEVEQVERIAHGGGDVVSRLRAYALDWSASKDGTTLGPDLMLEAAEQIDRARSVIESAPHYTDSDGWWCQASAGLGCTCWKADVL